MGQYLYAIALASESSSLPGDPANWIGLNQSPVRSLCVGNLAAVLSELPEQRLRPERKNLQAHQHILKHLLGFTTPLPMSFGVVSEGEGATVELLRRNASDLEAQLERVQGRVEMGLRVRWDVPNIFEFMISQHPELGERRDALLLAEKSSSPRHQERIELGRLFERLLEADRAVIDEQICDVVERATVEIHRGKLRAENDILNLACLVDRRREDEFVARVVEAASALDANYAFDYNGPWAPHNFVQLDLTLEHSKAESADRDEQEAHGSPQRNSSQGPQQESAA
jgi:hypothetical protein